MTDEMKEPQDDDLELDAEQAEDVKGGMIGKTGEYTTKPPPTSTTTTTTTTTTTPTNPLARPVP